jgi:hypothetical protein
MVSSKKGNSRIIDIFVILIVFILFFLFLRSYFVDYIAFSLTCWVMIVGLSLIDLLHYGEIARSFFFFIFIAALIGIIFTLLSSIEIGLSLSSFVVLLLIITLVLSR